VNIGVNRDKLRGKTLTKENHTAYIDGRSNIGEENNSGEKALYFLVEDNQSTSVQPHDLSFRDITSKIVK
jgi:hypothetical protein